MLTVQRKGYLQGFPCGLDGKDACNAEDLGPVPTRHGNPLQYLLEESPWTEEA